MSAVALQMVCVAGLLGLAVLAIVLSRSKIATTVIYGATLAVSAIALAGALRSLLGGAADATTLTLPVGLPWLGAHFRLDALASFFLVVINLGGASASLYGLGYGHHDPAPHRVLPFFPAFLAGMNLVVLADDAFSYLLCWEFMSLASWALVMAHHRERGQRQSRLRLSGDGKLRHARLAAGLRPAGGAGGRLRICSHSRRAAHAICGDAGADPDAARRRLQGRPGAACMSGCRSPIRRLRATCPR